MDFGKAGKRVSRTGWNGKSQYIELATCVSYKNAAGEIIKMTFKNFFIAYHSIIFDLSVPLPTLSIITQFSFIYNTKSRGHFPKFS